MTSARISPHRRPFGTPPPPSVRAAAVFLLAVSGACGPVARAAARQTDALPPTAVAVLAPRHDASTSAVDGPAAEARGGPAASADPTRAYPPGYGPAPVLPAPSLAARPSKFARVVGWRPGEAPRAPAGYRVTPYAAGLQHPRWLAALPNGDVLVAEANNDGTTARDRALTPEARAARRAAGNRGPSADRVTLLRDTAGRGVADVRVAFLTRADGLDRPFGMAFVPRPSGAGWLYVAATDALWRFPFAPGDTGARRPGTRVLALPADGYNNHWTRNVIADPAGRRLYVTVGSGTNADVEGEDARDPRRAAVLEVRPDDAADRPGPAGPAGVAWRVFASGLRNPNGLAWEPATGALWAAVNERDGLGDDLPPDYITRVGDGAFYGWPYAYWGGHEDPRHRGVRPDLVARARTPDYATGAHTATMALVFYAPPPGAAHAFPARYRGGAFVTQRGSWDRASFSGYRVLFIPFRDGRPAGPPEPFLTGFAPVADTPAADTSRDVRGRPVGLAVLPDGALLVADDAGDHVWRVAPAQGPAGNARANGAP